MLTSKQIEEFTQKDKPYRVADSYGLSLVIHPNGSRYWIATVTIDGKRTTRQLGKWPELSATAARKQCSVLNSERAKENSGKTFKTLAEEWHTVAATKLKSARYAAQIWSRIDKDVLPKIGHLDASRLTRKQLVAVVQSVADRGSIESAHRLAQYLCRVLDHGVDTGLFESHQGADLGRVLPAAESGHHAALPHAESGELFRAIWKHPGLVGLCLRLLSLTFLRSAELVGLKWSEVTDDSLQVEADRMKMEKPHVVPLSKQAQETIARLRELTGDQAYVFATKRGHINRETPRVTIAEMGFGGRQTAHGIRSIFSSAAYESNLWSAGAIERQLAHKESDEVVRAYNRAEFLDERRRLMQWWADFIDERKMNG